MQGTLGGVDDIGEDVLTPRPCSCGPHSSTLTPSSHTPSNPGPTPQRLERVQPVGNHQVAMRVWGSWIRHLPLPRLCWAEIQSPRVPPRKQSYLLIPPCCGGSSGGTVVYCLEFTQTPQMLFRQPVKNKGLEGGDDGDQRLCSSQDSPAQAAQWTQPILATCGPQRTHIREKNPEVTVGLLKQPAHTFFP